MDMTSLPPGIMQILMQMMQQGGQGPGLMQMMQGGWGQPHMGQPPADPAFLPSYIRDHREAPFGWQDWLDANHPSAEWQPGGMQMVSDGRGGYSTLPQQSNVAEWGRTLSQDEIEQFKAAQGLRGDEMLAAIPERFRNTPEALQMAQLGRNPGITNDSFSLDPRIMFPGVSGPGELKPVPLHKYDYASQYGYGSNAAGAPEYRGQQFATDRDLQYMNGGRGPNFRQFGPDSGNILQTLKSAGWTRDMGFGPQTFKRPEGQAAFTDKQQVMLNDLLYSISPRTEHAPKPEPEVKEVDTRPAWEQDPWGAMQGIMQRNAYVNDTLGGNFYGGVIPDDSMRQTWGRNHAGDPHFAKPQRDSPWTVPSPNDATGGYDAYPGWATNPSNSSFGNSPWGAVGQHTWAPPQQAPTWQPNQNSTWGGNQKNSANGSPWGNKGPWG
jgi:hypothetical protein